jgi:hypothetical protein
MQRKYNEGNWEQRRLLLDSQVEQHQYHPTTPAGTAHKRKEMYFNGHGEITLTRIEWTSGNGEQRVSIMYILGADGVGYILGQ